TVPQLRDLPVFGGRVQRRYTHFWLSCLHTAQKLPSNELPHPAPPTTGPPPVNRWADKDANAAARLAAVRTALTTLAEHHRLPVENLLLPDLVRRLCWNPPEDRSPETVADVLRVNGARPWQIEDRKSVV